MIVLAVFSIFSAGHVINVVRADESSPLEAFYAACIDQKIAQCQGKVRLADCSSENLRSCGEDAATQLAFYTQHKQKLIADMMAQDIGYSRAKADYLLIKAHQQFLSTQALR